MNIGVIGVGGVGGYFGGKLAKFLEQGEIAKIAKKQGISLPADIVQESFKKAKSFPYDTKTSFQRDFEQKDKPDERDLFGDTIIRLGESLGVETLTVRIIVFLIPGMPARSS